MKLIKLIRELFPSTSPELQPNDLAVVVVIVQFCASFFPLSVVCCVSSLLLLHNNLHSS